MHWLIIIVVALLSISPAPVGAETTFSGANRIEVRVVDEDGDSLPGAGLSLCPLESGQVHARNTKDNRCLFELSREDGSAAFDNVTPGEYRLTGNLSGFADTTVFPLAIGRANPDPLAPDRVTILLNPVCYDC